MVYCPVRRLPQMRHAATLVRRRCLSSAAENKFSIVGSSREGRAIYLDSQATTPLDPRVLDAMLPYMTAMYGNPHSRTHAYGWESADVVEDARSQVPRPHLDVNVDGPRRRHSLGRQGGHANGKRCATRTGASWDARDVHPTRRSQLTVQYRSILLNSPTFPYQL